MPTESTLHCRKHTVVPAGQQQQNSYLIWQKRKIERKEMKEREKEEKEGGRGKQAGHGDMPHNLGEKF